MACKNKFAKVQIFVNFPLESIKGYKPLIKKWLTAFSNDNLCLKDLQIPI